MPLATVMFDEAHSQAWTIRPELAAAMQPAHPADSSLAGAAATLATHDFAVACNPDAALTDELLAGVGVLILAHPSDPRWERTTGSGSPRLSAPELDAIERFVARGGGLIVLGETEQEKYGNNLNELLARFGLHLENDTVQDYEHNLGVPSWILPRFAERRPGPESEILTRVAGACLYRSTTITCTNGARILARTHASASTPDAAVLAVSEHGRGRVAVLGDSDLFGDDCLDTLDHRELWRALVSWVAPPRGRGSRVAAGPEQMPAWQTLREQTDALALLQAPDGSLAGDPEQAARHVGAIAAALTELAPRFAHQQAYIDAARADLARWAEHPRERPDFTASLELFRPERERRDGLEHLVLFPMYKQNGSRDTCFEALIIRVPWPEWIAELEATRYDNPKFVPVQLIAGTAGYQSECAVLFPETVATAERPANHFGAIFCDREAERLARVAGAAAELTSLNLPADAVKLLGSPPLLEEAYILWDLIHDRAHSHGDLPFDPFMIRQRAPYWMYSLEELRCDLTAFTQALELEQEGLAGPARRVQYAILLDRLLRFPITGERTRNYDALGGQLLFAYLHRHDLLHWTDNRLRIDWARVADGVRALHREIGTLYRDGIDRTKLAHWEAAHDLIAAYVAPAAGSRWASGVREFAETPDPRPYVDEVLPDEFPLSIFYSSLRSKLAA
jgi:hypothetical protein